MEKWTRPAQGELSRMELIDMKVHNTLFTTFYVQIVSLMKEKYGVEGAKEALRQIGQGCAVSWYKYVQPLKTRSIKRIINYIIDNSFYYAVVFKESQEGLSLLDKNCPICWEGVLEKDIPYCCIIDGFLERYLLINQEEFGLIPKVEVRAIKSKATGDRYCEHLITRI